MTFFSYDRNTVEKKRFYAMFYVWFDLVLTLGGIRRLILWINLKTLFFLFYVISFHTSQLISDYRKRKKKTTNYQNFLQLLNKNKICIVITKPRLAASPPPLFN